jgi:hypothetical protein
MASESSERKVIITILLVSTLLTMLGVAGLMLGISDLSLAPIPEDAREMYGDDADLTQIQVEMIEVWITNPYRRPMAAANVVVSSLVLIGSFMLSWRRRLAQWWIRQAVTAKVIWIAAYTATLGHHIQESLSASTLEEAGTTGSAIVGVLVVFSVISAVLHAGAAYRATRPDIGAFIDASQKSSA